MSTNQGSGEEIAGSPDDGKTSKRPIFVTVVTQNDILMGRGANVDNFEGNRRFREIVRERKREYICTSRNREKQEVALHVIQTIHNRGGSFLRKVSSPTEARRLGVPEGHEAWTFVDDKTILEKVKQAFRSESTSNKKKRGQSDTNSKDDTSNQASLRNPTESSNIISTNRGRRQNTPSSMPNINLPTAAIGTEGSSLPSSLPSRNTASLNVAFPESINSIFPSITSADSNLLTLHQFIVNAQQIQHQLRDSRNVSTRASVQYEQSPTILTDAQLRQLQQLYQVPATGLSQSQYVQANPSFIEEIARRNIIQSLCQTRNLPVQTSSLHHQIQEIGLSASFLSSQLQQLLLRRNLERDQPQQWSSLASTMIEQDQSSLLESSLGNISASHALTGDVSSLGLPTITDLSSYRSSERTKASTSVLEETKSNEAKKRRRDGRDSRSSSSSMKNDTKRRPK